MNLKRYRDFVIVLLALAVPFWFLRASMRDPKQVSGPDKVIVRIATPVQYAAATLARGLSNLWGDYIYLVDVKEDNTRLSSQNIRLQERVRKLEALEEENRRLKRLLDLRPSLRVDVVSAQVIGKNTNEFFRVARVTLAKVVEQQRSERGRDTRAQQQDRADRQAPGARLSVRALPRGARREQLNVSRRQSTGNKKPPRWCIARVCPYVFDFEISDSRSASSLIRPVFWSVGASPFPGARTTTLVLPIVSVRCRVPPG